MKILAVDDDELVIRLLDGKLKNLGYSDVEFAKSGAEALDMIERSPVPYQCFLLDIRMPGMDGVELCRRVRAMPAYRQTPIIMLTALVEKQFVDQSFVAGATDYLTKPFENLELGARLRVASMLQKGVSDKSAQTGGQAHVPADVSDDFTLSDAVTIHDVPRVISALALENYLLQLSRIDAFRHAAIGFQIENVAGHFHNNTREDFYDMIVDVADVIFEVTRSVNPLIAYLGTGSFVAIVPRINSFDHEEMTYQINTELDQSNFLNSLGQAADFAVSVGPQINSKMFGRNANDLILRAIESAQPERQPPTRWQSFAMLRAMSN